MMNKQANGKARTRLTALTAALMMTASAACSSPEQKVERFTESGQEFLEEGEVGKANVQFQNALKINEDHIPALQGIAEIAEDKQDFRNLYGILQRIVRLDPNRTDAHVKIGKIYLIGGDTAEALESAETALGQQPENPEAMALKAAVLLKLDDVAGAVELARAALEKNPANPEAVAVVATERAQRGDEAGALEEIENALEIDPEIPVLQLLRMQLLANLGRTDDMMAAHREIIDLYPEEPSYRQIYARSLLRQNQPDAAREQLAEIVRLSPAEIDPKIDVVRLDYQLSGEDAAIDTFRGYVDERPNDIDLKFRFGGFLRQLEDYSGAEAVFDSLASGGDEGVVLRARNEIAALRLVQGEKEEAREIIDDILEKDERNTDALLKRAGLKIDAGDYDDAILDLRAVINDQPDSSSAKVLMATAFEKKGDLDFAKSQMAQAVADSENDPKTANVYARLLMRTGEPAEAERALGASLDAHPNDVDNLKLLASVQLMQQDWRGAEETARRIETASAEDPSVNRILGAAYTGLEDHAGAISALEEENRRAPLEGRPLAGLVSAYMESGRGDEAETMLRSMIDSNADNYSARMLLASTLASQEKSDEAEDALREAMEAAPDRAEATETLYRKMISEGRREEAGAMLDRAIAASPDNIGAKMLKADYLLVTDAREDALAIYEDVLERRPEDPLASNNYASLLGELRDDDESRARALEVASALEGSDNPYFLDTLGWAQYRTGDYESAVANLEKAVAGSTGFAEAHYHLGAAYIAAGESEKARVELEKAVENGGDAPYVQQARDMLAQN